jgi:hypothetical protein
MFSVELPGIEPGSKIDLSWDNSGIDDAKRRQNNAKRPADTPKVLMASTPFAVAHDIRVVAGTTVQRHRGLAPNRCASTIAGCEPDARGGVSHAAQRAA